MLGVKCTRCRPYVTHDWSVNVNGNDDPNRRQFPGLLSFFQARNFFH